MKRLPKGYFIIPLITFPFDVMVSIGEQDNTIKERLLEYCDEEDINPLLNLKPTCKGRTVILPSNQTVIRIDPYLKGTELQGVIAHEIFHSVVFITEAMGIKFDNGTSDEVYAYLIQYITGEFYRRIELLRKSSIQQ